MDMRSGREELEKTVYRDVGCGYAVAACLAVKEGEKKRGLANVSKSVPEAFGKGERELLEDAVRNAAASEEARLCPIGDAIFGWDGSDLLKGAPVPEDGELLVLTAGDGIFGAAALFYPGVRQEIGRIVGNYYVLPSSVHEMLILPEGDGRDPVELAKMVKAVNESQVAEKERLGDRVLRYRADADLLYVAADLGRDREIEMVK